MNIKPRDTFGKTVRIGLIGGIVSVFLCLVGIVEIFGQRSLIENLISLGHVLLFLPFLVTGYLVAKSNSEQAQTGKLKLLLAGILSGLLGGGALTIFLLLGNLINIRAMFIHASPTLYGMLTFGRNLPGAWIPLLVGALLGSLGSLVRLLPSRVQQPLIRGFMGILLVGLFAGLVRPLLISRQGWPEALGRFLFGETGLTEAGALIFFVLIIGIVGAWSAWGKSVQSRISRLPRTGQSALRWSSIGLLLIVALILPQFSGAFIAQVIVLISLNILMGLGLNITLGFAGLLDLGFVAFFAMGAYTVGLLTSYGEYGLAHLSFWAVVPIAIFVAFMVGAFLGLPVLGMRGDYLAIATLGFGEIVRLLAGSDFLGPWLGGPQGVIGIQKPCLGWLGPFQGVGIPRVCHGWELGGPKEIYYLAIVFALIAAFVAARLRDFALGESLDGYPRG